MSKMQKGSENDGAFFDQQAQILQERYKKYNEEPKP